MNSYFGFTKTYDWLGFFGGFLGGTFGGIATFMGVYLTLQYQRNADQEKNRLSVIPILEYKINYNKDDFDNSLGQLSDEVGIPHINIRDDSYQEKEMLEWHFNIIISNVGIGHAQISEINFTILNGSNHEEVIETVNLGYSYQLVKKNHDKSFKFLIYAPAEGKNGDIIYAMKIMVIYQDLLGSKYGQLIHAAIASSEGNNFADLHYYENFKPI